MQRRPESRKWRASGRGVGLWGELSIGSGWDGVVFPRRFDARIGFAGGSQRLDVADQLPALGLWKFGPYRHAAAHHAVGDQPKQSAGSSSLHLRSAQAGGFLAAIREIAVAFCAMQAVEFAAGNYGIGILLKRIAASRCLPGGFRQFSINVLPDGRGVRRLSRRDLGGKKEGKAAHQDCSTRSRHGCGHLSCSACRHRRPPNMRSTAAPKPENSRETPQRSKKRWLLSFKPKPVESRRVQSDGRFQAMTGAR